MVNILAEGNCNLQSMHNNIMYIIHILLNMDVHSNENPPSNVSGSRSVSVGVNDYDFLYLFNNRT